MSAERPIPIESKERQSRPGKVQRWFEGQMQTATMQVDSKPLEEIAGGWQHTGEKLINPSPQGAARFYKIEGRTHYAKGKEAQPGVDQPIVVEVKDPSDPEGSVGTIGLLVDKQTGKILVQIAARPFQAEPGEEPGAYLTLMPSLQGSYTNLTENRVPFSENVDPQTYTHFKRTNTARVEGKIRMGVTDVDAETIDLSEHPNYAWFTATEFDEAVVDGVPIEPTLDALLNLHRAQENVGRREL